MPLHVRIGNLHRITLFTVLKTLPNDVLLGTAFIEEHILAVLPDVEKIAVRKSTPVAIMKQYDMFANAAFTKQNMQNTHIRTHSETKDDPTLTIKYWNIVRVIKQKLVETQFVTTVMVTTKT